MAKIGYFQLQHPTSNGDSQAQILKVQSGKMSHIAIEIFMHKGSCPCSQLCLICFTTDKKIKQL